MISLSDLFQQNFKAAAAEGAVIELKLRLLADKVPALQSFAHAPKLEDVETQVTQHFASSLTEEDKKALELCRRLRNKILHCDFRTARDRLNELGAASGHGGVRKVQIAGLSNTQIEQRVSDAVAEIPGTFEYVADTAITQHGGIYGWLLEMNESGDFCKAVESFKKAARIVDRLAMTAR